jgi:hypothetical protein
MFKDSQVFNCSISRKTIANFFAAGRSCNSRIAKVSHLLCRRKTQKNQHLMPLVP